MLQPDNLKLGIGHWGLGIGHWEFLFFFCPSAFSPVASSQSFDDN
ncbi:hypothetical protein [Nostoc sp.]